MRLDRFDPFPLSERANAWLNSSASRQEAIAKAVEAAASKDARLAVVARYAALGLKGGGDSVDLIREDRDGR